MGKVFTIVDGKAYFEKGGDWYLCNVLEDGLEISEKTNIKPNERFSLIEVRAKVRPVSAEKVKIAELEAKITEQEIKIAELEAEKVKIAAEANQTAKKT